MIKRMLPFQFLAMLAHIDVQLAKLIVMIDQFNLKNCLTVYKVGLIGIEYRFRHGMRVCANVTFSRVCA